MEAEYIAITKACKDMLWMKKLVKEPGMKQSNSTVYMALKAPFMWEKNQVFTLVQSTLPRVRFAIDENELFLDRVNADDNDFYIMTKGLPKNKHYVCCTKPWMGLVLSYLY